jgi:hypothetical protein
MWLLKKLFGWGVGIFVLAIVAITWLSGGGYNTDLPPPAQNAKLNEIFLNEFQGTEAKLEKLDLDGSKYIGYKATYGNKATITVIQSKTVEIGNDYFKTKLVPIVDGFKTIAVRKSMGGGLGKAVINPAHNGMVGRIITGSLFFKRVTNRRLML